MDAKAGLATSGVYPGGTDYRPEREAPEHKHLLHHNVLR